MPGLANRFREIRCLAIRVNDPAPLPHFIVQSVTDCVIFILQLRICDRAFLIRILFSEGLLHPADPERA